MRLIAKAGSLIRQQVEECLTENLATTYTTDFIQGWGLRRHLRNRTEMQNEVEMRRSPARGVKRDLDASSSSPALPARPWRSPGRPRQDIAADIAAALVELLARGRLGGCFG